MARRESRSARREPEAPARKGKGGGLAAGLVIGLVGGLVIAAALAWYFNLGSRGFKTVEETAKPKPTMAEHKPAPAEPPPAAKKEETSPPAPTPDTAAEKKAPAADTPAPAVKPRVDYTFYGILPGDKPAKPVEPPKSKETWWLQVAALKNPVDADKLKARLALLGLEVSTQKVDSAGQPLYRVRVGPYKREDDALGDLDTLAQNNFEPRLFKEPPKP